MNCAHCGAPVTLEEKFCPNCGQPNTQALQHSRDMAHYRNEFENTRRGVNRTLSAYKGITARLIIFVIAVGFMIAAFALMHNSYSMQRNARLRAARADSAGTVAILDDYIEHKDYVSLWWYSDYNSLSSYRLSNDERLGEYYPVIMLSRYYSDLYNDVLQVYTADDPTEHSYMLNRINEDLGYIYERVNDPDSSFLYDYGNTELVDTVIEDISMLTDALLIRYLGLTDEEAESFYTMSDARRSVVVEDKIKIMKEERNEAAEGE